MGSRCSDRRARPLAGMAAGAGVLFCVVALAAQSVSPPAAPRDPSGRAAARMKALQDETDALARQESTLLGELRKLEVERQLKTAALAEAEARRREVQQQADAAAARAQALAATVADERPDIERRLVRVYKLGRAGFWRLLLDIDNLKTVGRAYRTAAALSAIDKHRVEAHRRTVAALADERAGLTARLEELTAAEAAARAARDGIARATAARAALVASIDARRDLNAQLIGELQAAQERLQSSVSQLAGGPSVVLPLRAFKGALPWPADGRLAAPFGRRSAVARGTGRNGVDLAVTADQPVLAVHEGRVAYAEPFTGYGLLVIVEHGPETFSLYGYLADLAVARGDLVAARQPVGRTGFDPAGKPSLYFELRVDGKAVDPLQWLMRRP